ncbi:MAG TPA: response regulator [Stellaceae bacterium]|nr:response regulator [Stellaceae bacterium]
MIFILDDDAATRDSLRLLLECEGLRARAFASGRAFLDAVPASEEGCLLLDVQMPGMSGFEVLEALRRRGDERAVIILTGQPSPAASNRAAAAGALAFVEKPYRADALLALVHHALERRPGAGR